MKTALLAFAFLFAVPALAAEDQVLIPVSAQVIWARPMNSANAKMTLAKVRLKSCGAERCTGTLKIALPNTSRKLAKNSRITVLLQRPIVARLGKFKKGGSLYRLALVADAPPVTYGSHVAGSR
jgi:hypothetical protein